MTPRVSQVRKALLLGLTVVLLAGGGAGCSMQRESAEPAPAPEATRSQAASEEEERSAEKSESTEDTSPWTGWSLSSAADATTRKPTATPTATPTPALSPIPTPTPSVSAAGDPLADWTPAPGLGSPSPAGGKIAYLTFDDGPSGNTEAILEVLRRQGVKATFFVTGKETETAKELYRRMDAEGHKLGNHTYSHDYVKLYRNPDLFMEDVRKLDRLLESTVGHGTDILRFPGGSNTRLGRRKGQPWMMPQLVKRVRAEGYQYFDWNVTSTDAAQAVQPKADILSSVLTLARNKNRIIVLMHDVTTKKTTVEALPEVIRGLKRMGFDFAPLEKDSFTTQFLQ